MRRVCLSDIDSSWPSHLYVTDDGRIYSESRKRYLKGGNVNGHTIIAINRTTVLLHRIVALAFIPNPDNKPFVNHIDGVKSNNDYTNLEWCTREENERHACEMGLKHSKLSRNDVVAIKHSLQSSSLSIREIAEKYDVPTHTIYQINDGKTWTHVSGFTYPIRSRNKRKPRISQYKIDIVRNLLSAGKSYRFINRSTGVAKDTIKRIKDKEL